MVKVATTIKAGLALIGLLASLCLVDGGTSFSSNVVMLNSRNWRREVVSRYIYLLVCNIISYVYYIEVYLTVSESDPIYIPRRRVGMRCLSTCVEADEGIANS